MKTNEMYWFSLISIDFNKKWKSQYFSKISNFKILILNIFKKKYESLRKWKLLRFKKQIVLKRPLGAEKSICVRKSEQIFAVVRGGSHTT